MGKDWWKKKKSGGKKIQSNDKSRIQREENSALFLRCKIQKLGETDGAFVSADVAPDHHGVNAVRVSHIERGRASQAGVFGIAGPYVSGSSVGDDVLLPVSVCRDGRLYHEGKPVGRIEPHLFKELLVTRERALAIYATWQADDVGMVPDVSNRTAFAM